MERVARWSRATDGSIILFLQGPAAGVQQLSLRGVIPVPESRSLPLPGCGWTRHPRLRWKSRCTANRWSNS